MVQEITVTRKVDGVEKSITVPVDIPATTQDCIENSSQEIADNLILSGAKARAANALRNLMAKGITDEEVKVKMAQWRLDKAMERTRVPAQVQIMREMQGLPIEEVRDRLRDLVNKVGAGPSQEPGD